MTTENPETTQSQPPAEYPMPTQAPAVNYIPPEPVYELQRQLAIQSKRIADLEARLPKTNLLSRSYLSRAFAVWGHNFVSSLIISAIFTCLLVGAAIAISLVAGVSFYEIFNNIQITP